MTKTVVLGALLAAFSLSFFSVAKADDMMDHHMMHQAMKHRMMRHEMHHRMMRHHMMHEMMHHDM